MVRHFTRFSYVSTWSYWFRDRSHPKTRSRPDESERVNCTVPSSEKPTTHTNPPPHRIRNILQVVTSRTWVINSNRGRGKNHSYWFLQRSVMFYRGPPVLSGVNLKFCICLLKVLYLLSYSSGYISVLFNVLFYCLYLLSVRSFTLVKLKKF